MSFFEKIGLIIGIFGIFVLSAIAVTRFKGSAQSQKVVLPTAVSPTPAPEVVSVHSIDGTKQIIMRKKIQADNSIAYSFSIADVPSANETVFFTKTIGGNGSMSVPLNAWSPQNTYLFLQEEEAGFTDIFVFKADGTSFTGGQQYLDVSSLFAKKQTGNVFRTVTGWDSYTLMHVQTTTNGTDRGPNYWFDVPSTSFIQLAS